MRALILVAILFLTTSFNSVKPLSDTWYGNTASQVVSGNALRDGATATGLWTITTTIPAGMNKEIMTKANLVTYTNIPTGNAPLNAMASNECPTISDIESVF